MKGRIDIVQFFYGKTIFITGATGFLAKVVLEKILRIQPNIKRIFLLIRATKQKSSSQRLYEEIIETDLFRVVKEKCGGIEGLRSLISEKVVAVCGDISCDQNLGINQEDYNLRDYMYKEIDIIINSAATTNFHERYDVALGINTFGALNVLSFAKKCLNAKLLLHVSTAYVCGERAGLIPEKPLSMGKTMSESYVHLDIDSEKEVVDDKLKALENKNASLGEIRSSMKELGIQRAKLHGWPNTYVFTKAMGEMILEQFKDQLEVVIIRPTIVSSTYKEPFPGWIEGVRTLDSIVVAYGKGSLKWYIGDPETTIDLIPSDMVVNSMLMAIVTHVEKSCDHHIYHVGSSLRNPLKYGDIHVFLYSYFVKNPWINGKGKFVKVGNIKVFNSMEKFHKYVATHHMPLLWVLNIVNILTCRQYFDVTYTNFKRKINLVLRLAEVYKTYMFFQGIFEDTNTEKLRVIAGESGLKNLELDPKGIKWEEYFMNTHTPMVVKYLF
ncbi:hypothetical protein M9H77_16484 [Catharanthus roseus]|uniref:Uncharacterized protein n=1 Tax=Catharanthus roseus TaxID=4058 RepID=A0ACC0B1W1_CATRO|nr:hypothetical protein M9H77_16484 [Catharanthus roseus]